MASQRARVPKLPLTVPERAALRQVHLSNIDLVRLEPARLAKATGGVIAQKRAVDLCALAQFQSLPNVGPSIAEDLLKLGLHGLEDVKKADPGSLLRKLERLAGRQDPCVGDVLHSAVWHANNPKRPERPWWEWSRQRLAAAKTARRKG